MENLPLESFRIIGRTPKPSSLFLAAIAGLVFSSSRVNSPYKDKI